MFRLSGVILAVMAIGAAILMQWVTRHRYPVHDRGAIFITGASTGIGNHAAVTVAKRRQDVLVLAGVRKEKDAKALESLGLRNLRAITIDVSSEESIQAALGDVQAQLAESGLSSIGLVNNAVKHHIHLCAVLHYRLYTCGISNNSPVEFLSISRLRDLLEVNVVGLVRLTQLLLRDLRKSQGRIVNISSVLGKVTMPTRAAYCASKHAVEAVSDVLRVEMLPFNVSVSLIEPAYVRTEIFGKIANSIEEVIDDDWREVYGGLFYRPDQAQKRRKQIAKASPPDVTTDAIEHALFDPYPRPRHVVANFNGLPASVLTWAEWALPDRVLDRLKLAM